MSQEYNLTDNVDESFQININEHKYTMRYPTLEEIEKAQELQEKSKDDKGSALADYLYTFITPITEGSPTKVQDVLNKLPFPVMRNFRNMINKEFGVEE